MSNKGFNKEDIIDRANQKIINGKKVKAIVAFVDLLGFSNELAKYWDNSSDDFLHRIMRIKSFVELARENGDPHEFVDNNLNYIDKSEYPTHISFSDSFIFIKEIDDTNEQTIITSLISILSSVLELWKYAIEEGFTLRGAIDFGEFFYSEHDIIGPAFISTYKMESKVALISRIICSDEIAKIVNQNILQSHPVFQEYVQLWLKNDIDNKLILNPCIAFNLSNEEALELAKTRVEKMRFDANDHESRNKYNDLIERLSDRSKEFSDMKIFDR